MEMMRKILQCLSRSTSYKFFLSILHNLFIVATKNEEAPYVSFRSFIFTYANVRLRCLRVFDDLINRVMMKEFPGDLGMDKGVSLFTKCAFLTLFIIAYLQSIVGIDRMSHKVVCLLITDTLLQIKFLDPE